MELACDRAVKAEFFKLVILSIQIRVYLTFGCRGRDNIVGIVILYGLDGRSRWGQDIFYSLYLSRPASRPTQFPVQWVIGLFFARRA